MFGVCWDDFMKIFTEATGSMTSGYLVKAIQEAGHLAVGSDISKDNHGFVMCDDFIVVPRANDPDLWPKMTKLLQQHKVDIVIPSFDETMIAWAERADEFSKLGIRIVISPLKTIEIFQSKWNTYNFFKSIGIKTPNTSLTDEFDLIKPDLGRGGSGIFKNTHKNDFSMEGMVSQDIIEGQEYTVDVMFANDGSPLYIIPRKRIGVVDGKSTQGLVVNFPEIDQQIRNIATKIKFVGPINFQLFVTDENELIFIEINPRVAGGMALGFAASENWMALIAENMSDSTNFDAKPIQYGLKMVRYYAECFI